MAAEKLGKRALGKLHSSPCRGNREPGGNGGIQKRHARVTVKYDRKELQKRLDVEKWIDECLAGLYLGKESEMPEEVNIDDLLDLENDDERHQKLQELLKSWDSNTEVFAKELLLKLKGLPKQNSLKKNGLNEHSQMESLSEGKEHL